ncbi:5'/3'-nucleotidase SurE [Halanaerobium hydrogeniformans]|uniref:5'/3'-nucleotidase SurE n=1 Tax=Halanaerobium hydrogeniformans TaxID=656519 RepID=UPI00135C5324|nr:5'/3'-nucleotidase SurE [Halanaerobium hydrogeniformans]
MKILLTNDDGVYADGITDLATVLSANGHYVTVAAPDRERSASGHAITLHDPLRALKIKRSSLPDLTVYSVNGTPADCVKLAIEKLLDFEPDLIISGINHGPNLGLEILYSGTVSAAIEGSMLGFPSLAVSMNYTEESDFKKAAEYIVDLLDSDKILVDDKNLLLNINFPVEINDEADIVITKLGKSLYIDSFVEREDPFGNKYFWLNGSNKKLKDDNTDISEYLKGNISITPLKIDLTDNQQFKFLSKNFPKKIKLKNKDLNLESRQISEK